MNMSFRNVAPLIVGLLILSGCVNQRKATTWFNEHEQKAAEYCAVKYPVKESIDSSYTIDSAAYNKAFYELWAYSDSLLNVIETRKPDTVRENGVITITKYKSLNIDSLRKEISVQVRRSLKPCVDSIKTIVKTVENTAKVQALTLSINAKDDTISKRDLRITNLEGKLSWYKRAFFSLCGLLLLILLIIFRKLLGIRIPFLN
jgi:hypothetical protein